MVAAPSGPALDVDPVLPVRAGDAIAEMYPERHALRYGVYGGALYALGSRGARRKLAALGGAVGYAAGAPSVRPHRRPGRARRAVAAVHGLLAFVDVAKMAGYLAGMAVRARSERPGGERAGPDIVGVMSNRKRKSTAAKQRAKLRQQRRAAAGQGGDPAAPQAATRPQPAPSSGDRSRKARKRRRSARTPLLLIGGVVAIVGIIVVVFLTKSGDDTSRGEASEGSIDRLTSVPAETLETVGVPDQPSNVNLCPTDTAPVEEGGKPVVLYVGAEYCAAPSSAGRWSWRCRFGTFTGLASTTSAPPPETLANTPTVTFKDSTFTSDHLVFSSVETGDRFGNPIDDPTEFQQRLFDTYNVEAVTGSSGGIPFIMVGTATRGPGASTTRPCSRARTSTGSRTSSRTPTPTSRSDRWGRELHHGDDLPAHGRPARRRLLERGDSAGRRRCRPVMPVARWVAPVTTALALAGVGVSTYLTIAHYTDPG